jgi:hypothetical protein
MKSTERQFFSEYRMFFPEINPHNETLHIKTNLCFVYWVLLCFSFVFLFLKICIIIQWYVHSVFWKKLTFSAFHYLTCERIVMSQRQIFSTVSCFRRFVSHDKISHYFDRFICQKLYYDAEIAWMISKNLIWKCHF